MAATMKAWRLSAYGEGGDPAKAIATLKLEDVPAPTPGKGEVCVKVEYASVNPIDWKLFSGGFHAVCPCVFPYTPGFDIAGSVCAVGEDVTDFKVGDGVIANTGLVETCCTPPPAAGNCGAFAEYAVVPANFCSSRGAASAESLAGLPLVGLTSYQALFTGNGRSFAGERLGDMKKGDKLLVLGGSSSAGLFAIQMCKEAGIHVAVTASSNKMPDGTPKMEFVKTLGANEVIDYKNQDWSEVLAGKDFDQIYDCVGDDADLVKASKVLKKGGSFVSIANFNPASASTDEVRFANYLLKSNAEDLNALVKMTEKGSIKVFVDSVVPFADVPAALTKSLGMQSGGKILIKVA
mmetsp:Transcript_34343/g.78357  ORF Transcript_34343/g.78357 Transcript_34343/m.78357 type:complete len:350 (+) Transcript_34343:73-1122(+)|eukprot:CAMPEP_0180131968 /NCGR_PEP_ID=MMETSP0986-20121125/8722_1 /TAXON_ID=697907 /ORGANISM="non described non described, Strain CCMP2293" /LENGTH=349 /DNA_ID=CAMNT_0022071919 /DNA_START=73 /DNA_END=1122 /DNA_ORIENTATION=+